MIFSTGTPKDEAKNDRKLVFHHSEDKPFFPQERMPHRPAQSGW